jgi:hypothetical protein
MTLYRYAETLIKQCIHNLGEADWASRHVTDREPDLPDPIQAGSPDRAVSSLSLALRRMGLVQQTSEVPTLDYDA